MFLSKDHLKLHQNHANCVNTFFHIYSGPLFIQLRRLNDIPEAGLNNKVIDVFVAM